jgi:hypothetical protein
MRSFNTTVLLDMTEQSLAAFFEARRDDIPVTEVDILGVNWLIYAKIDGAWVIPAYLEYTKCMK